MKSKRLLVVESSINGPGFVPAWEKLGVETRVWRIPSENMDHSVRRLSEKLQEGYAAVFTYDFHPQISDVCNDKNILYIAWVVDNPCSALFTDAGKNAVNRVFVFDRDEAEYFKQVGVPNIYYLPLGSDVNTFQNTILNCSAADLDKFSSDVSFVGALYSDKRLNLYSQIAYLPPYVKGYLEGLMQSQTKLYGNILSTDLIGDEVWNELKKYVRLEFREDQENMYETQFMDILYKEVARLERCEMVDVLARLFDFKLYTGSDTSFAPHVKTGGYVHYYREMPLVFHGSKININRTMRSITSGMPLRVLDIMACGGFLLSNPQKELAEYFAEDQECVFYYSVEDMCAKIEYYLQHDEQRKEIAAAGQEKVRKYFSLERQIAALYEQIKPDLKSL